MDPKEEAHSDWRSKQRRSFKQPVAAAAQRTNAAYFFSPVLSDSVGLRETGIRDTVPVPVNEWFYVRHGAYLNFEFGVS